MRADGVLDRFNGIMLALPVQPVEIEFGHEQAGGFIVHLPQGHENGVCSSFLEAALKAKDPIAGNVSLCCLTGAEGNQIHSGLWQVWIETART